MSRKVSNGLNMEGTPLTGVPTPTTGTDAANRDYVDAVARGLDWKPSVRAASTGDLNLAAMPAAVDGVTFANGDRFLAKDQAAAAERGLYTFEGTGNPAVRALDADDDVEVTAGMAVSVTEGTTNGDTTWVLTTNDPIVVGTTGLTFSQLGGATPPPSAGNGLTLSGNTYAVGAGAGITVGADDVSVDTAVVVRKYATSIGNGSATSIAVTHNLGTRDVTVAVFDNATFDEVLADVAHTDANTVTIGFATAPANAAYRVVVHG